MKRSELKKAILEEIKGYSKYAQGGETKGGTTDDFRNILTAIAKQGQIEDEPQDEPEMTEGTANELGDFLTKWLIPVLEKGVGRDLIKLGFKDMIVKEINDKVSNSQEISETVNEGEGEQTYLVHFRVGEDDEDDVEVKATSPEEAIEKAKAGKTAGGQNMPRLARSFSAKLYNK
jgi:hypothetical protein